MRGFFLEQQFSTIVACIPPKVILKKILPNIYKSTSKIFYHKLK